MTGGPCSKVSLRADLGASYRGGKGGCGVALQVLEKRIDSTQTKKKKLEGGREWQTSRVSMRIEKDRQRFLLISFFLRHLRR